MSSRSETYLPKLTSDICNTMPNLEFLWVSTGLQEIDVGALDNCTNLENISLYHNKLTKIDSELFKNTPKILEIHLYENQLTELDPSLLRNTPALEKLSLSTNLLKEIRFDQMPRLEKLKELDVNYNELSDVDEFAVVDKFPALTNFVFCENQNIPKERHNNLTDFFLNRNVNTTKC